MSNKKIDELNAQFITATKGILEQTETTSAFWIDVHLCTDKVNVRICSCVWNQIAPEKPNSDCKNCYGFGKEPIPWGEL
jgi:hypothetical protein